MNVGNEMADLEGCGGSMADHSKHRITGDTGSADGSPNFTPSCPGVRAVLHEPCRLAFHNFGPAHKENRCDKGSV